jgi:hypothetical protein
MTSRRHQPEAALIDEIERYLAVVDAFRAAGSEPEWRADGWGRPSRARRRSRQTREAPGRR